MKQHQPKSFRRYARLNKQCLDHDSMIPYEYGVYNTLKFVLNVVGCNKERTPVTWGDFGVDEVGIF